VDDPDEQQRLFLEFWNSRNDPGRENSMEALERYYDRVFYANEHFKEEKEGWKTDRGRAYILYGAPELQSSYQKEDKFYEVWTYNKWGLRFLFLVRDDNRMEQVFPKLK
jgi:GWxTD domain-containing protein